MAVCVGYSRAQGIVTRWLTCFGPPDSDRLYVFHSADDEIASLKTSKYKAVRLFYDDPEGSEVYRKVEEACASLTMQTRISF